MAYLFYKYNMTTYILLHYTYLWIIIYTSKYTYIFYLIKVLQSKSKMYNL